MTKRERLEAVAELAALMQKGTLNGPHVAARESVNLCAIARRMHKRAEHDCNFGMSENKRDRLDTRDMAQARAILEPFGLTCGHQGDPRGWPLLLYVAGTDADSAAYSGSPREMARVCPHV